MIGNASAIIRFLTESAQMMHPEVVWEIKKHKEKRTLTQNSYYWVLQAKVAKALKVSTSRLHNLLLRDCGYPMVIGGRIAYITIPDTDEAENEALEAVTYHIKPTSGTTEGNNGTRYRIYMMLKGSHEMDTAEFSHLVDLLVEEARHVGIETIPDEELARLKAMAEKKDEKRTAN